jgi:hypothetical protein
MKLVAGAAKGGREGMRERQRREQAAARPLREIYPGVATLRFDFKYSADMHPLPAPQSRVLHPPANAYFTFPCPFSECAGHFDLAAQVRDLLRANGTHATGTMDCCGERVHPQGRSGCRLKLEYSLEVTR